MPAPGSRLMVLFLARTTTIMIKTQGSGNANVAVTVAGTQGVVAKGWPG